MPRHTNNRLGFSFAPTGQAPLGGRARADQGIQEAIQVLSLRLPSAPQGAPAPPSLLRAAPGALSPLPAVARSVLGTPARGETPGSGVTVDALRQFLLMNPGDLSRAAQAFGISEETVRRLLGMVSPAAAAAAFRPARSIGQAPRLPTAAAPQGIQAGQTEAPELRQALLALAARPLPPRVSYGVGGGRGEEGLLGPSTPVEGQPEPGIPRPMPQPRWREW